MKFCVLRPRVERTEFYRKLKLYRITANIVVKQKQIDYFRDL